jgi:coatomer subunit beta
MPLDELPLTAAPVDDTPSTVATTTVREDGTYAMNIVFVNKRTEAERSDLTGLRAQIVSGDYFLAATLANTLAKLVVQLFKHNVPVTKKNIFQQDAVAIMHELIRYGTSRRNSLIDDDSHERIRLAITIAQNPQNGFLVSIVDDSFEAYHTAKPERGESTSDEGQLSRIDQPVVFSQLNKGKSSVYEIEASIDDLGVAVANEAIDKDENFLEKLQRAHPLSGFNDPVYCEAVVTVHQFDILIEWLLVNQTNETLQNLTIEVASRGDMKLCERPQSHTVAPRATLHMRSSLKVSSTETGVIFGNILYDTPGNERSCVILNEIHVDIMDYIHPEDCSLADFRRMWNLFEWENKIVVNTELSNLQEFVERVIKETNMQPLEPIPSSNCGYLSSSLYAKSAFGEDALANISLEVDDEGKIEGAVRIRSKTQAIALGLGDKVTLCQKKAVEARK